MTYNRISDLPASVKESLPEHAQEIFLEAYNNAEEKYSEEERSFRVAWGAVKRDYQKCDDGKWHRKPE